MAETDYVGTGIFGLRTEAGKVAKLTGQRLNQRNKWSRRECLDFLTLGTMPERFTPVVIDNQLPMFDDTAGTPPDGTDIDIESDSVPFTDSKPLPVEAVKVPLPVTDITSAPLKTPLPIMKPQGKQKPVLANGRNSKNLPSFDKWFGRVYPSDVAYPAWKYLTKTSTDVANICRAKHDHAANCNKKDSSGFPWFEFSFKEAVAAFKISRPTFDKSIKQLVEIGFIKYVIVGGIPQRGNFQDGRGTPAQYRLSHDWKTWSLDENKAPNLDDKGKLSALSQKQNPSKPVFTSTSKPTFTSGAE